MIYCIWIPDAKKHDKENTELPGVGNSYRFQWQHCSLTGLDIGSHFTWSGNWNFKNIAVWDQCSVSCCGCCCISVTAIVYENCPSSFTLMSVTPVTQLLLGSINMFSMFFHNFHNFCKIQR